MLEPLSYSEQQRVRGMHVCAGTHRRSEPTYVSWLARCLIMSGKAAAAWQLYQTAQDTGSPAAAGEEGYALLQLIANDCYKMGAFYYAIKVSWRYCEHACECLHGAACMAASSAALCAAPDCAACSGLDNRFVTHQASPILLPPRWFNPTIHRFA